MSNAARSTSRKKAARYRPQSNESQAVNNNKYEENDEDVNSNNNNIYDRTQQLPTIQSKTNEEYTSGLRRLLLGRRRQRREEKKERKHNNNNNTMGCQQSVALADNRQKPSSSGPGRSGGGGAGSATTTTTTRKAPGATATTTTTKPKPFVVPTASADTDNEAPQVTISYPPPPQSSSSSVSPGIGKNRTITNPKLSASPGSGNGTKKVIPTSWNKTKGVGKANNNSAQPPPPPLTARPRTDTWEINLAASPAPLERGQGGKSSSVLEATYELVVVDVNDKDTSERGINTAISAPYDDGADPVTRSPTRLASAKAAASQQSKALAQIKSNLKQQEMTKYTVQDQWKMLWDTQSNNLVDPADVLAVIDTLLDKTVNRLSPVQVTFIQRKVRYAINRLYTTKPGTNNTNNKKLFGGSNNNNNNNANNNNNSATDYAEARVIAEKYHLIPEMVVRHMILPRISGISVAGSANNVLMTSVTNNVIALMLSLSSTSSESYLWDRTAFAANAAAEIAKLEMDVNKRYRTQQVMPKPSQVPIIEGAAQFPPGITLTALSAIIAIAVSSTSTRQQKLQLLFYICFQPESLIEFLISHPAGGVATWLLEVDNHVVLSLSSLTHYHYYGHAFLPSPVPMFDDVPVSTEGNKPPDSKDENVDSDDDDGAAAAKKRSNGSTNNNETTTTPRITKRRFIPSQSRKAATVPLHRVHSIVDTILQIEQQNVRIFQQKKLDELNNKGTANGEASVATTQNETATVSTTGSILRRSQRGGLASEELSVNASSHHNTLGNSSLHKKLMGRRVSSQNNMADIDSSDSIHGGGAGNNNSSDISSCFTVTDVMERLIEISSPITTTTISTESDGTAGGQFCYPADDSTTLSSLDISREQFLAGTSIFVQNRYGVETVDSVRTMELSMEEFVHWAETALDDLALHIVLHKIFAEGILPSPSLERDLVLSKWLEWQQTIRAIMAIANTTNHRQDNNDSLNSSSHVDKDGFLTTNGSLHSSKGTANNLQEETKELSYSMQALLSSSSSLHKVNGQAPKNGESNGNIIPLYQILRGQMGTRKGYRNSFFVWGGLGNVDGGGGIGYGVLYCISKEWWNQWTAYTGWTFSDSGVTTNHFRKKKSGNNKIQTKYRYGEKRPWTLSTEVLIEHDHDSIVRGSMGSYEVMRQGLVRGEDYVLVPPGVWDVLYEMYGGGPPLPRMIRSLERRFSDSHRTGSFEDLSVCAPSEDDFEMVDDEDLDDFDDRSHVSVAEYTMDEVEIVPTFEMPKAMKIPDSLSVTLHPWIIHVQLCDPTQPYRRGEAGPVSIRLMATPYQPLWRLFSEILCRFSFQQYKAFDADGRGKARLWKKTDPASNKEPVSRYGPWNLLCKSRHAILPIMSPTGYGVEGFDIHCEELIENWKEYVDNATVETGGLSNNDHLMLEFAVQNKNSELTWPREAAAKAGRVRRLAEEDKKFRYLLQGLSEDGTVLLKPPSLVGLDVDAMDSTGRWYTVRISDVDIVDDDTDEEGEDDVSRPGDNATKKQQAISRKKVKVIFKEHGGQTEWIDVESDRLATAGRFASQAEQDAGSSSPTQSSNANTMNSPQSPDSKSKAIVMAKKTNATAELAENAKLCTFPGFGACGLGNLGNTCYMNSAVQCISYLPMLRSYLISAQYKSTGDLNKDNVLGSGGKLLEETAELMRSMWSSSLGERSPTRFRTILGKTNPQFSGADQQDAQEFLNYIIDALHEDSYKGRKKPYVEPLEDDWVNVTNLARVGEEAWRRFLRRNRSVMADVAMGQALNTVTCPVCKYSSRNFDPFNLLSIPIPTVAEVVFQCTVYRRASAKNCPWVLAKVRKGDKRQSRFDIQSPANIDAELPPSEHFIAERYYVALSRLADSGDLRLQIQNLSGIRANQLRLCRIEEVVVNEEAKDGMVIKTHKKVFPLSDKDGPASQQTKKRSPNDENKVAMTEIVAFEMTLNPRVLDVSRNSENGDDDEEEDRNSNDLLPSPKMAAVIERHLEVYGDDMECRMVDTDSLVIAKAVSRSLWPRSEDELKLGLRVDAMDHRGNWFPGSVIEIVDDKNVDPSSSPTGGSTKRVRVHFDNFSPKWDENYSIEHFMQGRVKPLYSHAIPKRKPTEFLVHHRHTDRQTGHLVVFGQSFYVQCQNEWSNARAGAHILAQVCRFMHCRASRGRPADANDDLEMKTLRLYEKTHSAISDLIDLLVDCDREYVRLALGVSQHNNAEEKSRPFRNPTFDASLLSSALVKKVTGLLQRLPFEVRICTVEGAHSDKPNAHSEEVLFPFSLVRTIGNFMNIRHAVFLQWREPTVADKKQPASAASYRSFLSSPVMYVEPNIHVHEASASLMNEDSAREAKKKKAVKGDSTTDTAGGAGIELSYCLKEFCKVQKLSITDSWKCPVCKVHREGGQNMNLWRLPDLLTFHIKRFNMSARWHEKITTKVNFPITGLDMRDFCHVESPVLNGELAESTIYDLIGVMNHYGSMTGGHYVATCKATAYSKDGREEVAYSFNGIGASTCFESSLYDASNGVGAGSEPVNLAGAWVRLGGARSNKNQQEIANQNKLNAAIASRSTAESAEPMWLQFDDEVVEPIPPAAVVSEMAYVLFYRRRNLSSSNIVKYSTLE